MELRFGSDTGVAVSAGVPPSALRNPVVLALAAGYFGSLANALAGEPYRFAEHVCRYLPAFLVFTVAPVVARSPLVLLVSAPSGVGVVVVLLALLAVVVASYLLYATPSLLVLRDTDLVSAARASAGFAADGGAYRSYAVGFAATVAVVSAVLSAITVSVPIVGLALGLPVGAVLGLAGNLATMRFVADIDPRTGAFSDDAETGPASDGSDSNRDERRDDA